MDGIIDNEIMDEIAAEQDAQGTDGGALSEVDAQGVHAEAQEEAPGRDEAGGTLPELEPMPDDSAPENSGGEDDAQGAPASDADKQGSNESGISAQVMGLLGVSTQEEAIERLKEIAVGRLMDDGAPESVARELVDLRMRMGGAAGAFRARDEPEPEEKRADAPDSADKKAAGDDGREDSSITPRIREMAMQAKYIEERTGVKMLDVIKKDSELMRGISEYNEGRGGFDMIGAYNAYREKVNAASNRARIPATGGMDGGQSSSGRTRVEDMTDEDIEKIEARVRRGERVVL